VATIGMALLARSTGNPVIAELIADLRRRAAHGR
jgi:hypothetical protein